MKKLLVLAGLLIATLVGAAAPAGAAGQVCYDVAVNANGAPVVAQAGCQPLP